MAPTKKHVVHIIAGTRPNFVKIAPLFRALSSRIEFAPRIIHTGQHFDSKMSGAFFTDLEIPAPHVHLGDGGGSHATQTARILTAYEKICIAERPDWVIVVGDVDSTLAACLAAKKLNLPVAHLEAGLRSRDRSMPEEINRLAVDAISDLLWTTSPEATQNLIREGAPKSRIKEVGNVMIDSLVHALPRIKKAQFGKSLGIEPGSYAVVTLHRPSNVDDVERLGTLCGELQKITETLPVVFPVHPRTAKQLVHVPDFLKWVKSKTSFHLLEPLGYLNFLSLVSESMLVVTDSGGIQEETAYLGVPCLILRDSTERPVVLGKTNRLVAITELAAAVHASKTAKPAKICLPKSWDGKAAVRAAEHLSDIMSEISHRLMAKAS